MARNSFDFHKWFLAVIKLFRKHGKVFLATGIILIIIFTIYDGYLILKSRKQKSSAPKICVVSSTPKPTATVDPKIKEFGLKIKKLDVFVPVVKNVDGADKKEYRNALKEGVAHFSGTALPGEKGNTFIFGHSSADYKTDYAKVFVGLNDLEAGDEITVFYQGQEHKYKVKDKEIIEATDTSVLDKGKKEILTLMTCWPIGTKDKRLIIRAQPI